MHRQSLPIIPELATMETFYMLVLYNILQRICPKVNRGKPSLNYWHNICSSTWILSSNILQIHFLAA